MGRMGRMGGMGDMGGYYRFFLNGFTFLFFFLLLQSESH